MTKSKITRRADSLLRKHNLDRGEPAVSTFARAIVNGRGEEVVDFTEAETSADLRAAVGGVKTVDVLNTAARLDLTAAEVNVGDIVREVGRAQVLGTLTVSGAGTEDANGDYEEDGTEQDKIRYRHTVNTDIKIVWAGSGYWMVYDDNSAEVLYKDDDELEVDTPFEVLTWVEVEGDDPVPVLTEVLAPISYVAPGGRFLVINTAELDNADGWQEFTEVPSVTPYNAGNITGATTLDHANGAFQKAALTGAVTLNAPSNGSEGKRLELWLTASGANRDLSLHASILVPSDSAVSFPKTLTSAKTYIVLLRHNGTAWMLVSLVGGY